MPAASTTFPVSPGPTFTVPRTNKAKVNKTQFGDGYYQFTPDGLNNIEEEWQLQWENLTTSEMLALRDFLKARKGAEHYNWLPPENTPNAITGVSRNASNVSLITTAQPHGLSAGTPVIIQGVADSTFNGNFTCGTVVSPTQFQYANTGAQVTSSGGYAIPTSQTVKARCEAWSDQFVNAGVWNFSATFNRVYTP